MKPQALDAIATQTMRPSALEAAMTPYKEEGTEQVDGTVETTVCATMPQVKYAQAHLPQPHGKTYIARPCASTKPSTPFGQLTDGTESAAKVVEEVVHDVKAAVDGVVSWAEKKVDELSSEPDSIGPYTSLATCMPSDLDAIATGVLPAMPAQAKDDDTSKQDMVDKKDEDVAKGEGSGEA